MTRTAVLGSTMIVSACALAAAFATPASAQDRRLLDAPSPTATITRDQIDTMPRTDAVQALRTIAPQPWQQRNPPLYTLRGIADNGLEYGFRLRDDGPSLNDVATITVLREAQGPFFGLALGGSIGGSPTVRSSNFGSAGGVDLGTSFMLEAQAGVTVYPGMSAALAWQYRPGFDLDYRHGTERVRAGITNNAVMVNFRVAPLVAFPQLAGNRGVLLPIQPTFEFGLGAAINRLEGTNVTDSTSGAPLGSIAGRTTTQFAWTIGGGANFDLSKLTGIGGLSGTVGYRYVDMGRLRGGDRFTASGGGTSTIDPIELRMTGHDLYLRFSYRFGAPPPAP